MKPLLIAEACNPEWVSVPLVGWKAVEAIRDQLTDSHLITQIRNQEAIINAGWVVDKDFTAIDSEAVAKLMWRFSSILRGGKGKGWTTITALNAISYQYFEYLLWRQFKENLKSHVFDIVHRITPLSPTCPSNIAKKCAKFNIPFILGPINGGVPWPKQFSKARRKEKEWLSYVRDAYKLMPGYRATREHASAIIVGSKDTYKQISEVYHDKCIYIPENAIDPERFSEPIDRLEAILPLRIAFLGRLVPYKGADMLLEATAPLIKKGMVLVDIIGDGPEMKSLQAYVRQENLESGVSFAGWIEHKEVQKRLKQSDVLGFPSIREFGGAVVLEAMALGMVPVIVDYAGPAELVSEDTGYKVQLGDRQSIINSLRDTFERLIKNPESIRMMGKSARKHVLDNYTWQIKANQIIEVYHWVLGNKKDKPVFYNI